MALAQRAIRCQWQGIVIGEMDQVAAPICGFDSCLWWEQAVRRWVTLRLAGNMLWEFLGCWRWGDDGMMDVFASKIRKVSDSVGF